MSQQAALRARESRIPKDKRALVAVDLGAESCRVSLLRWHTATPPRSLSSTASPTAPSNDNGLRWPLATIEAGIDDGLRRCAELAPEGIRSIAVDGWAVDYVRLDADNHPLAAPFCYRDARTIAAQHAAPRKDLRPTACTRSPASSSLASTPLYQLYADNAANLPPGTRWLNLPEYMLTRWGAAPFAEYTNATHTGLIDLSHAQLESRDLRRRRPRSQPRRNAHPSPAHASANSAAHSPIFPHSATPNSSRPPATTPPRPSPASPHTPSDWAYISSGTWSLIGTLLAAPCNSPAALADDFTNLGAVGNRICFHKTVNGMWLLKQCMDAWTAAGTSFTVEELVRLASLEPAPAALLDVADPELGLVGNMPARINAQLRAHGHAPLDESPAGAPRMAALIFHSLAAAYAVALEELRRHTGHQPTEIVVVGGGCRNDLLCQLTAERTGLPVRRGAPESSTIGNLAVQLAALEGVSPADPNAFAAEVSSWAATLLHSPNPHPPHPLPHPYATPRTPEGCRAHHAGAGHALARAARSTRRAIQHGPILLHLQRPVAARLRPRACRSSRPTYRSSRTSPVPSSSKAPSTPASGRNAVRTNRSSTRSSALTSRATRI